jgi:hypothetical protein
MISGHFMSFIADNLYQDFIRHPFIRLGKNFLHTTRSFFEAAPAFLFAAFPK